MEIYFCSIPGVRDDITETCVRSWFGRELHRLTPELLGVTNAEFQKARRVYAEENAGGPYYIVADDDCVPHLDALNVAILGEAIMDSHPEFAILSMWPDNATLQRWTPEGYMPYVDDAVEEHVSVGGIRMCRKGMIKDWPELVGNAYDMAQCRAVRETGKRAGYFRKLRMTHLGEGISTLTKNL